MVLSSYTALSKTASTASEALGTRTEILRTIEEVRSRKAVWDRFLTEAAGEHAYMHDHSLIVRELELNASTFKPLFVIVWDGDEIQCLAPFYIEKQPCRITLGVMRVAAPTLRMLKIFGGAVVYRDGSRVELALQRVFDALHGLRREFDTITFFELTVAGDLWNHFQEVGGTRHGFTMVPATTTPSVLHYIQMAESYEAYLATFGGKRRKAWRKVVRLFEGRCPQGFEVVRVTDPDAAVDFLEDVDRVYPTTWQAQTLAPQRHAKPANSEFYRTVAGKGWFRAYTLKVDGVPIAFSSGFQHEGVYFFDETGYDAAWRDASPGTVLLLRIMEDLHAHVPPRVCHFGYGDGLQKQTFGTYSVDVSDVHLVPVGSIYGRAVVRTARWMDSLSGALRRLVTKIGIDTWLREGLKRGRWFKRGGGGTNAAVIAMLALISSI